MKKRRITLIVLYSAVLALNAGNLIYKYNQKKAAEQQRSAAAAEAQRYLEEKYGFRAEVNNDSPYPQRQKLLAAKNIYEFSAEHDGEEFSVFVRTEPEMPASFKDSYQSSEIADDIKSMLEREFPVSMIEYLWFGDNDEWNTGISLKGGFTAYYDGEDLCDYIRRNGKGSVRICVAEKTLANSGIEKALADMGFSYSLTAFDSAEHLHIYQETVGTEPLNYELYKNAAPYITEHIDNNADKRNTLHIELIPCGDFLYAYLPAENRDFPASGTLPAPEPITAAEFIDFFDYDGSRAFESYHESAFVDTPVSGAWHFDCPYGDVMIYYPLEKLQGYDLAELGGAWFSRSGIKNNRNIEQLTVFGDYAVLKLRYTDMYFMLVDLRGKESYTPAWSAQ